MQFMCIRLTTLDPPMDVNTVNSQAHQTASDTLTLHTDTQTDVRKRSEDDTLPFVSEERMAGHAALSDVLAIG